MAASTAYMCFRSESLGVYSCISASAASREGIAEVVIERDGMKVGRQGRFRKIKGVAQPSNPVATTGFLPGYPGVENTASTRQPSRTASRKAAPGQTRYERRAARKTGTSAMLSPT